MTIIASPIRVARPLAVVLTVESLGLYSGHEVRLNGHYVGYRPFDGSNSAEVGDEVMRSLAGFLRERLGWAESSDAEDVVP